MYRLPLQRTSTALRVMPKVCLPHYTTSSSHTLPYTSLFLRRISSTPFLWKENMTPVPKMGDSITEGTLLKFTKNVGENVALDEIVAIIETDKVTVDVRSPDAGVLKAVHAKVQESVKVGAPLFTIDTDGKGTPSTTAASSSSSSPPSPSPAPVAAPVPAPAPVPSPVPVASSSASSSHHRTPAIHFRYGQRQIIDQQTNLYGASSSSSSSPRSSSASSFGAGNYNATLDASFPSKATRNLLDLPPMYGRPIMSINEMYLIDSGGAYADVAPPAPKKSGGKK